MSMATVSGRRPLSEEATFPSRLSTSSSSQSKPCRPKATRPLESRSSSKDLIGLSTFRQSSSTSVTTSKKPLSADFVDAYAGSAFNIVPNKATVVLNKNTGIDYKALPEDFDVKETDKGIEITAHGVTTHAAGPERGVNAIRVLTNALLKLNGLEDEDHRIIEFIDNVNNDYYGSFLGIDNTDEVSGQTVSSGTVLKFKDGHISLLNDCRYCVTDNGDRLEENVRKKAEEWDYDVTVEEKTYGYHLDVNGPIIQTIKKVYQEFSGDTEREILIGKGGKTGANVLTICRKDMAVHTSRMSSSTSTTI